MRLVLSAHSDGSGGGGGGGRTSTPAVHSVNDGRERFRGDGAVGIGGSSTLSPRA